MARAKAWRRILARVGGAGALALGLVGASVPPSPGAAGTFYRLYADRESAVFVDRTSVVRKDDQALIWATTVLAHPPGTGRRYVIAVDSWQIDCEAPRELAVGEARYDEAGRLVEHNAAPPNHWASIYPGSPMDVIRARVCGAEDWPAQPDFIGAASQLRANFLSSLTAIAAP